MEASIKAAAERAKNHGIDLSKLPQNLNMDAHSITANVHAMNAGCKNERTKFIFDRLHGIICILTCNSQINHLHDFVRETSLTNEEWMTAIQFLTETGQKCTDIRQEFILLSDTLGVSTLVDSINNAKPPGATEGTVLGPFFTEDAPNLDKGASIASEGKGDYMFVEGIVKDVQGKPVPNAIIDTWETDGQGQYDTQYDNREFPDCRGRLRSAADGSYAFRAVVPVSYPIPGDGTVGRMMSALGRHIYRPAHLHIQIAAPGYETLTTSLFFKGDPYLSSDAVFGVKSSLIEKPVTVADLDLSKQRGFKEAKPHAYLKRDFVLATNEQGAEARELVKQRNADEHN